MNKEEALWVTIRAIGLIFLVFAFKSFVEIVASASYFIYAKPVVSSVTGSEAAISTMKTLLTKSIGSFILYGFAAYYFMRKGLFVHRALSK